MKVAIKGTLYAWIEAGIGKRNREEKKAVQMSLMGLHTKFYLWPSESEMKCVKFNITFYVIPGVLFTIQRYIYFI